MLGLNFRNTSSLMAAWGPFDGQERQKSKLDLNKARHLSSSGAHAGKSVVYQSPFSVDTLYGILVAAQTNHYGAQHQNNYALCFGEMAAF